MNNKSSLEKAKANLDVAVLRLRECIERDMNLTTLREAKVLTALAVAQMDVVHHIESVFQGYKSK